MAQKKKKKKKEEEVIKQQRICHGPPYGRDKGHIEKAKKDKDMLAKKENVELQFLTFIDCTFGLKFFFLNDSRCLGLVACISTLHC